MDDPRRSEPTAGDSPSFQADAVAKDTMVARGGELLQHGGCDLCNRGDGSRKRTATAQSAKTLTGLVTVNNANKLATRLVYDTLRVELMRLEWP